MLRTVPIAALAALALISASAGCSCSQTSVGASDAGGVRRDDGGRLILPSSDGGGTSDQADGGPPMVTLLPGHFGDPGNTLDGVGQTDAGWLTLDHNVVSLHFAWLANPDAPGTVSKIDTTTGKEVARYLAVLPLDGKGAPNGLTYNNVDRGQLTHATSRTAVDLNGDVWVANRAFGTQGSVTKIANNETDCVDRNGNGTIETSRDNNGNGVIDADEIVMPTDPTDPTQYDECVLFSTPLGTVDQPVVPRALAIDSGFEGAPGNVWVGLWCGMSGPDWDPGGYDNCINNGDQYGGAFVKLSPTTGEILTINGSDHVNVPIKPYGAAVDAKNRVWMSHAGHTWTAAVDGTTGTVLGPFKAPSDWGGYGVTVEVTKLAETHVWIANISKNSAISRYNVDTDDWLQVDFSSALPAGETYGQGRCVAVDDTGTAWMSSYADTTAPVIDACSTPYGGAGANYLVELVGIDAATGAVKVFPDGHAVTNISKAYFDQGQAVPCVGMGVGMDNSNRVWVAAGNGFATGVDRTTGAVTLQSPDVGDLYTYSDFTGYTLRTFTAPTGTFRTILQGCSIEQTTHWISLDWDGNTPANTLLKVSARSGATKQEFATPGTTYGPWQSSPADLEGASVPDNMYLQVEVDFISLDKVSAPALKGLSATFSCSGGIN